MGGKLALFLSSLIFMVFGLTTGSFAQEAGEMEAYRAIQNRKLSTIQDLADLILMYRAEYGRYSSPQARLSRTLELGFLKSASDGSKKLERGQLAYAIMKIYKPESGIVFWITGWEHYALRDVQSAEIMPARISDGQYMTGEQLVGTINSAEDYVEKRKDWNK
jgi:hypothetical protein